MRGVRAIRLTRPERGELLSRDSFGTGKHESPDGHQLAGARRPENQGQTVWTGAPAGYSFTLFFCFGRERLFFY